MFVLHANWTNAALHLWAESTALYHGSVAGDSSEKMPAGPAPGGGGVATSTALQHPFAVGVADVRAGLAQVLPDVDHAAGCSTEITVRLPALEDRPCPSDRLSGIVGSVGEDQDPELTAWVIPAAIVESGAVLQLLLLLDDAGDAEGVEFGSSLRYFLALARFVADLLADQRFVPTLMQGSDMEYRAAWQPWLHDAGTREYVGDLLATMPPIVRAVVDGYEHQSWPIMRDAIQSMTDAAVRRILTDQGFFDAIEDRDRQADHHVGWLDGLLRDEGVVRLVDNESAGLLRDVRAWIGRLDETGEERPYRLGLRLLEPVISTVLADLEPVAEEVMWRLSFHLQGVDAGETVIDADHLWQHGQTTVAEGLTGAEAQELFLSELGRAARIYAPIESSLREATPHELELTTNRAYEFLREYAPILEEAGITVVYPEWWRKPGSRFGTRLQITSDPLDRMASSEGGVTGAGNRSLGLQSLVAYEWKVALGTRIISHDQFDRLAEHGTSLVPVDGKWVEIRPEELSKARDFLHENERGTMTVLQALQTAFGVGDSTAGLPVQGVDATGWVADLLQGGDARWEAFDVTQPKGFHGELRPYQVRGLRWLAFLDGLGLGGCLADDMGLGKTIQMIALLLHERELYGSVAPTLLVAPMSVVSNWARELERFAPSLTSHVHHGLDRAVGNEFVELAMAHDVVISTYGLVSRDSETIGRVDWRRVVLDEAQYVKNPPTKQSQAIRSLRTQRRVALTGTPVENRLTELWSIMEFCNPGYLGSLGEFRRRFVLPIERRRDPQSAEALRGLIRPFILRRLKTDPDVVPDLPELVQTKEYATLTTEQARLYEAVVENMLQQVDGSDGVQRRGAILAGLVRLKQVCNHPANLADEAAERFGVDLVKMNGGPQAARSGKLRRIIEMLEEVVAAGDKALVFTQFRRMGHLLAKTIEHDLDVQTLFLHGGTTRARRQDMIDRFQSDDRSAPVFILSLRAGGVGLNLTAANHVFHFDRWWNPAVENQATDRAFRIGQKRTVHAHKLICEGTLEERIDEMIEQKTELADRIVGAGETWLTELSGAQLRDLLTLRGALVEADA